eukprot:gene5144-5651_t
MGLPSFTSMAHGFYQFYQHGHHTTSDFLALSLLPILSHSTKLSNYQKEVYATLGMMSNGDVDNTHNIPAVIFFHEESIGMVGLVTENASTLNDLFLEYAQKTKNCLESLRFFSDEDRLRGNTKVEDFVSIDKTNLVEVFVHCSGGGPMSGEEENADQAKEGVISIKIKEGSEELAFRVKKTTKMSKIFDTYRSRRGLEAGAVRFMYDGRRVTAEETPKTLEMEDGDLVEAFIEQQGGNRE